MTAPRNGCGAHGDAGLTEQTGCTDCRRERILAAAAAADPALPQAQVVAAVDAVLTHGAVARSLAQALAADPNALSVGAPPVVGRLVDQLRAHGASLPEPVCAVCSRTGQALTRSDAGGVCKRCRSRQLARACSRCRVVKPVANRDDHHRPVCARCADRPQRACGRCGRTRRIALRARDGQPDICDACFRMPEAICSRCRRRRPCSFATGPAPVCAGCSPRQTANCAHCGQDRPPTARWPEGPVCDKCYTAALRHRGTCDGCHQQRRLVSPAGPGANICADCAGMPAMHVCTGCGIEDKLYERGRCPSCALARRTRQLLADGSEQLPAALAPVYESITATTTPRTALNWLRNGSGAPILAELAAGTLAISHDALDTHPNPRAAAYLRQVLVANNVLGPRDEALASTEHFLTATLAGIDSVSDRRLVHAYATWRVLRRLRRTAERGARPRTYTRHARIQITAAARFLAWLAQHRMTLDQARQADVDTWLGGGPACYPVRDFLLWATGAGHACPLIVPPIGRRPGKATSEKDRYAQIARLLHEDTIDLTDRVAGALLLLYGQQLSRTTAMTTDQITNVGQQVFIRFGRDDVLIPDPLAGLLLILLREGRRYVGVGSPATTNWLFPGMLPGRPLTASRLGERLRKLGIHATEGRRAALAHLGAQLPAAVLADLLNLAPTTAVNWVRDAGGDWTRYAAQIAQTRNHQP